MVNYDNLHKEWDIVHQDFLSPTYQLRKKILLTIVSDLLEHIQTKEQEFTVLDVGCGTGEYSIHIAKTGLTVTGFDLSQYAINTVQEKCKNLRISNAYFYVEDVSTFKSTSEYDLIILSEVLEHLDNDIDIVKKYAGFLKKNGHLLFSVPFDSALWSSEDVQAGHRRRYDHSRIQSLLDNASLLKVRSICYGFPVLKIMWIIKIWLLKSGIIRNRPEKKTTYMGLFRIISRMMVEVDSHFLTSGHGVGIIILAKK